MPIRQMLNLAWHYLTKDGNRKTIDKLNADLIKPLPGQSQTVSEGVVEAEMAMFTKMFNTMNGKTK